MRKLLIAALLLCTVLSCEPREIDTINIRQDWKVMSIKENGIVVFDAANVEGASRAYSRFTIDLTDANVVKMTNKGGVKLSGEWALSGNYKKLLFTNMTITATSQPNENYEFDIISSKGNRLLLQKSDSPKVLSEYTLIHN